VDDEVDIIHQDPVALAAAFDRIGIGAEFALQANFDLITDRDVLAIVGAVSDEEVVGQTALRWI
jgi:hypothetical protein